VKIALGQINPTVGDFSGNSAKIIEYSLRAKEHGAELIIFPELSICGYPARDMVERPAFVQRSLEAALCIAQRTQGIGVICGFVTKAKAETGKAVMNSAALLANGKIAFIQHKMLLPTYDVFDEMRNFAPAERQEILEIGGKRLALTICEDAWNDKHFWPHRLYTTDPVDELMRMGADMVLNISASPFQLGKPQVRQQMLTAIARQQNKPVILVNQVGGNDSVIFDGTSLVISAKGEVIGRAKSFEEDLIYFNTESGASDLRPEIAGREECAYAALVLGTRDYLRKCGAKKALVGLSGGIDSALTACIGADALGAENVTGIGMPSPYSSPGSIDDAKALARNLGIRFEMIPISGMLANFRGALQPMIGEGCELTQENLQSRLRGNIMMALSNETGAFVLTTGNKSEVAVGYSTLYGDMAGSLAVISDVPKTMVYQLAKYVNRNGQRIPQATIDKPPSAELRPDQKDTDTLPPYEVLDPVLEDYIEDLKTAKQIAEERGLDLELVQRVVRMVERSEYKRQQAPIGLKITEKAFGVGRRFPIAARYEI